jgi:two-component system sensor histidine kinase YesM
MQKPRKNRTPRPIAERDLLCVAGFALLAVAGDAMLASLCLRARGALMTPGILGLLALIAAQVALVCVYLRRVLVPFARIQRTMHAFNTGRTLEGLFRMPVHLTDQEAAMLARFEQLLDRQAALQTSKKQAEYLALQNQINPHFLYNTLEAIRGDAMASGIESIAETTEALATYFRYTISTVEHLVTLEDELKNVENYFIIQKYRYGERIHMTIDREADGARLSHYLLPKLTFQPIVENAIIHGLESKVGQGVIRLGIGSTQSRLIVHIEDDGVGMAEDALRALTRRLSQVGFDHIEDTAMEGGIALVNVNNRIKLLFGEQYGLRIYSTPRVGTDVEITLPLTTKAI